MRREETATVTDYGETEPAVPGADAPREKPEDAKRPARKADLRWRHRQLAGDLDAIVLKAMRKEPQHRYAAAIELSEDIRRHFVGLPVLARQGT